MKKGTPHYDKLVALRRIEGQVRGIQKMVEEERYCIDIINAISAIRGALKKVETVIFKDHLGACVRNALEGRNVREKKAKLDEIYRLFRGV